MEQIGSKKKIKQHAKGERPNKRRVKLIVCWLCGQLDDSCKKQLTLMKETFTEN